MQQGVGGQSKGNENDLDGQPGWNKLSEEKQIDNDTQSLQYTLEYNRSIKPQRREHSQQDGDEGGIHETRHRQS